MGHEGFPEHKGGHLRVRLIVEQAVQRMIHSFLFTSSFVIAVQMERQTGDSFSQNADTGIHRCHLHSGAFRDHLARSGVAHEKTVAASSGSVLGLVPGTEQAR